MTARVLMLQGTASSVGKSLLCAGICRLLRQDGYQVAPFEPRTWPSTPSPPRRAWRSGGPRQCRRAPPGAAPRGHEPHPAQAGGRLRSQVVLMGRPAGSMSARDYFRRKLDLWPTVSAPSTASARATRWWSSKGPGARRRSICGSGDRQHARRPSRRGPRFPGGGHRPGRGDGRPGGHPGPPPPPERALVKGLIVNRFRGDVTLFRDGVSQSSTPGCPSWGSSPVPGLRIADEDSVSLETAPGRPHPRGRRGRGRHSFAPHRQLRRLRPSGGGARRGAALRGGGVRPGLAGDRDPARDQTTIADLEWLRRAPRRADPGPGRPPGRRCWASAGATRCWDAPARPAGVETPAGADVPGLGLLPVETVFLPRKATRQVQGASPSRKGPLAGARGAAVTAYEIHMGETTPLPDAPSPPFFILENGADGTLAPGGRVAEDLPAWGVRVPYAEPSSPGAPPATGKDLDTPGTPQVTPKRSTTAWPPSCARPWTCPPLPDRGADPVILVTGGVQRQERLRRALRRRLAGPGGGGLRRRRGSGTGRWPGASPGTRSPALPPGRPLRPPPTSPRPGPPPAATARVVLVDSVDFWVSNRLLDADPVAGEQIDHHRLTALEEDMLQEVERITASPPAGGPARAR